MTNGILYFHQGWTDIINCLSLVNYYAAQTDVLYLVIRADSKELVEYYVQDIPNIRTIYAPKDYIESNFSSFINNLINSNCILQPKLFFHGFWDKFRLDSYRNIFETVNADKHFVERFFTSYNIPFVEKVNSFTLNRNNQLEEVTLNMFVRKYGNSFILRHEQPAQTLAIQSQSSKPIINLDQLSHNPWVYIKVLELAEEIHLIDSFWAAVCYQLDAKYGLFQNKPIFVYPHETRGGGLFEVPLHIKLKPKELPNWHRVPIQKP